jgi:transitional endoplasmic reticulum ATPase
MVNSLRRTSNDTIQILYVKSLAPISKDKPSESSIKDVFQRARAAAPCVLVLEDLENLVHDGTLSYFLNQIDGEGSNNGIFLIATASKPERLDPALANRPSRFDRKYFLGPPNKDLRVTYAMHWRKKICGKPNAIHFPVELTTTVAELTEGFSFAHLQEVFVAALFSMIPGNEETLGDEEEPEKEEGEGRVASNPFAVALEKNIVTLQQSMEK